MELKEFIENTVTEVFEAVKELQSGSGDMVLPGAVAPSTVSEQGECLLAAMKEKLRLYTSILWLKPVLRVVMQSI